MSDNSKVRSTLESASSDLKILRMYLSVSLSRLCGASLLTASDTLFSSISSMMHILSMPVSFLTGTVVAYLCPTAWCLSERLLYTVDLCNESGTGAPSGTGLSSTCYSLRDYRAVDELSCLLTSKHCHFASPPTS